LAIRNNKLSLGRLWLWSHVGVGGGTGPPPGRKFNVWGGDWSPPDRDLIACRYRKLVPPKSCSRPRMVVVHQANIEPETHMQLKHTKGASYEQIELRYLWMKIRRAVFTPSFRDRVAHKTCLKTFLGADHRSIPTFLHIFCLFALTNCFKFIIMTPRLYHPLVNVVA